MGSFAQEVKVEGSEKVDYAGFAQILWLRSDWEVQLKYFWSNYYLGYIFQHNKYALSAEEMLWIVLSLQRFYPTLA